MQALLIWLARVSAVVGVLLIAVAVIARLTGVYSLGGFYSGTILQGGMAAVLLACLGYLTALAERSKD
jgi:hypothetical protein